MNYTLVDREFSTRFELPRIIQAYCASRPIGAEVGVLRGKFSEYLLSNVEFSTFYCIDAWKHLPGRVDISNVSDAEHHANFLAAQQRLKRFGTRAEMLRSESAEAAQRLPDGGVDFVYIDGDHSYNGCMADLEMYYPKIKRGGILAGHDYLDGSLPEGEFGVKRAVDEFVRRTQPDAFFVSREPWPSWLTIK